MGKFFIQAYNRQMTELLWTEDLDCGETKDAIIEAYSYKGVYSDDMIFVLWRRKDIDPTKLRLIAKFY